VHGCPRRRSISASEQRAFGIAGDQHLTVRGINGEGEDRGPALMGQRLERDPRRGWKRIGECVHRRESDHPQRHKRRGKTSARKRHEPADYHPSRVLYDPAGARPGARPRALGERFGMGTEDPSRVSRTRPQAVCIQSLRAGSRGGRTGPRRLQTGLAAE
jgi:hypothetical protein